MHATFDEQAHHEFLRSPTYQHMANEALRGGSIRVLTRDDQPRPGMWFTGPREIGIHSDRTGPDRASIMAFEVTNAYHAPRSAELTREFMAGRIADEDDWARRSEALEYEGTRLHHQMMQEGIQNFQWPQALDRFGNAFTPGTDGTPARWGTFEGYWQRMNRARPGQTSHADLHRRNYRRMVAIRDRFRQQQHQ